jgi:hypothetical protein
LQWYSAVPVVLWCLPSTVIKVCHVERVGTPKPTAMAWRATTSTYMYSTDRPTWEANQNAHVFLLHWQAAAVNVHSFRTTGDFVEYVLLCETVEKARPSMKFSHRFISIAIACTEPNTFERFRVCFSFFVFDLAYPMSRTSGIKVGGWFAIQ